MVEDAKGDQQKLKKLVCVHLFDQFSNTHYFRIIQCLERDVYRCVLSHACDYKSAGKEKIYLMDGDQTLDTVVAHIIPFALNKIDTPENVCLLYSRNSGDPDANICMVSARIHRESGRSSTDSAE
jgi:hypothetical protein